MDSVLTAPPANTEPTRIKKGSWETSRRDPACNSFTLEFLSYFLGRPGRMLCTSPSSDMQGFGAREGIWLVSLPYTKEGRAGMSSWKDQKIAVDGVRLRGRMRKSSLLAIKRSQVLGWGARNPPAGQAGSEAAFHISVVRTFLFICSSVSAKKEGGAAPFPPHCTCPQLPATAEGLKSMTPPPPAPSYQPGMFGLMDRF